MKCVCTLGSRAPATFSESAKLSCACPIFRREKFAEPTRYDALALLPLVSLLWDELQQAWFADDAAATGEHLAIRRWWIRLCELGHLFGYFPNAGKSWLVVKQEYLPKDEQLFADLGVQITSAGRRYLGGAMGCPDFVRGYLEELIQEGLEHLERLTTFAVSQPHAAYAAFVHGFSAKWSYFQRVIPAEQ